MTTIRFAARGPIDGLDPRTRRALVERGSANGPAVADAVREILARVQREGDDALRALAAAHDRVDLEALEVPRAHWESALRALDRDLVRALERAAANLRVVHEAFRPSERVVRTPDGVTIGRRPDALARVGLYAPGGRATYPSSLLMGAVPARVAGVREVVACSPPGPDGRPAPILCAAALVAGVDRLFAVGGAGAIAAMTYGTASIPRVDRIVGPGNAYVAEAKRQVMHAVGIDSPAGPSELLVIADERASPAVVAREMLAQAEHDADAAVVLVACSATLAGLVETELARACDAEPRAATIRAALAANGALLVARTLEQAVDFANAWAPEHLMLAVAPDRLDAALARVRSAGTVFLGERSSVAFGDYLTGANHVLPTAGHARVLSGLSTEDFMRWTTWQLVDRDAAGVLAADVARLALAEGLPAHAAAARQWKVR